MYMQTLMLLAVEQGLATCPQEVWATWPKSVGAFLKLPEELMLFAGMSMGFEDTSASINRFRTDREAFDNFAQMIGF
jgi:nitroreductase